MTQLPKAFCSAALLFAGDDSFTGAYGCAGAAVDAGIGIDVVDVAFGDGAHRAFGLAGAASHTVVGYYVSHDLN